jgi:hypothetical protein
MVAYPDRTAFLADYFRIAGDTLETPDSASMSVWLMRRSTT